LTNPLLDPAISHHDVDFAALSPEHFREAFDSLIPRVQAHHEYGATEAPLTFDALIETDEVSRHLHRVAGLLDHLNSVVVTPELRALHDEYMPLLSRVYQELGLDERVPARLKEYLQTEEARSLDASRLRIVHEVIEGFEREGVYLDPASKGKLTDLGVRVTELVQQYQCNLTDFSDAATMVFSAAELTGVPDRTLENATLLDDGRYEISMVSGGFSDILTYCEMENTRKAVYEHGLGEGVAAPWDNRQIVEELPRLFQARAQLLGFPSYAAYVMSKSMAGSPDRALAFEEDLAARSHAQAVQETHELLEFGTRVLGRKPEYHDDAFVLEKLRQSRYDLDSENIREYFPVRKVVSGLFSLLEQLYDISFVLNTTRSVWHEDVQAYDMADKVTGKNLGFIYLDLFKREGKEGGAWMTPVQTRHVQHDQVFLPVTYLVCNAPKDKGQEPTLEMGEIVTLFHEMGHTLHNQLTEVDEEFFSGLSHVQHDAVELPSQFLENFCWDYETLKLISAHVATGEVLPESEFEKLKASRHFMAASSMLRTARYSLVDMHLYADPAAKPFEVETRVLDRWQTRQRDTRVPCLASFSHIFGGDYEAGYYAYQWAEMLSADAFAALREEGGSFLEQKAAALRFRKHVLAAGGLADIAENFRAFRGRDPELVHLLRDYGIA
jgi:oligopeptidase A